MDAREDAFSARLRASVALAVGLLLALTAAACGEDDFANDPRPPAPIEVSANVDSKKVLVSPRKLGAGLANFTVSNQSRAPVRLTLVGEGPEDNLSSSEIPPGGVGNLKASLSEGSYEVTAGARAGARPAQLTVGPQRKGSQNDLLLP